MPYNVLGGQEVLELSKRRPVDLATLSTVDGISDIKLANYGAAIIQVGLCAGRRVLRLFGGEGTLTMSLPQLSSDTFTLWIPLSVREVARTGRDGACRDSTEKINARDVPYFVGEACLSGGGERVRVVDRDAVVAIWPFPDRRSSAVVVPSWWRLLCQVADGRHHSSP